MLFQEVEGECAIMVQKGIYKQVPVYIRNGYLYAKVNGGFVRLYADGSSSNPNLRLETITWDSPDRIYQDKFGRLCDGHVAGAKHLPDGKAQLLLGLSEE